MKIKIISIFLFLIIFSFFLIVLPEKEGEERKIEEKKTEEINLFFVGDIMLNRGVEMMVKNYGGGDFKFPFLKIKKEFEKSDILFGNLEGPISEKGNKVGGIYSFRFNPESINGLTYAGFNILSLANNHMIDYQAVALEDTMNILKENGISYVGAGFNEEEAFSLKVVEIKDYKIGLLAFTNLCPESWRASGHNSGIACVGKEKEVLEKIKESKKKTDFLIVSLHWGVEYNENPSDPKEAFFKECVNEGTDLVVGHHPHVLQRVEKYNEGWIAYSLGNFIFDQSFSEETMESMILKVKLKEGKIEEVNSEKLKINQYFQPESLIEE